MRDVLLVVCLTSVFIPLTGAPASACSCAPLSREELADSAGVVFTGVAASVTEKEDRFETRFEVAVSYKGKALAQRSIYSNTQEAACGIRFPEGAKYTVFAQRLNDGRLWTGLCSGNREGRIHHARYDLPPGRRL